MEPAQKFKCKPVTEKKNSLKIKPLALKNKVSFLKVAEPLI
jgi:hypothetical protein